MILAERLAATNRTFNDAALLFDHPAATLVAETLRANTANLPSRFRTIAFGEPGDIIPQMRGESLDLIVSVFDLHWVNDLPGMLSTLRQALKPDGLLMFALPGEGSLGELRTALTAAELAQTGGAALRVDPFPQIRQIGDLLQRTGYRLPVVDMETRNLAYRSLQRLVADLRDNGAACSLTQRPPLSRTTWQDALKQLPRDADDRISLTANMILATGWREHESQQKPLRPGSATSRLSDFL